MRIYFVIGLLWITSCAWVHAQVPTIGNIQPSTTHPQDTILITGTGFGSVIGNLQAWFGDVRGSILSANDNAIEVKVPANGRLDNIRILNTSTNKSVQSPLKFTPSYSGVSFATDSLSTPFPPLTSDRVFDVCLCDLDLDLKPDIIGTKDLAPLTDLLVIKNNSTPGNFSFAKFDKTNLAQLNVGAETWRSTCGDLNGDGRPDIIASKASLTNNGIVILRNTNSVVGTLSFANVLTLPLNTGHFATDIEVKDLNNDGKPEIIVANKASNALYIFLNESSGGTLSINPTPVVISVSGAVATLAIEVQDFTGDGKLDIVAINSGTIYLLRNNVAGGVINASSFVISSSSITATLLNDIASADFNLDGKLDLVVLGFGSANAIILRNTSTTSSLSFGTVATLATDPSPYGVDVSDLNGDKYPDILIGIKGSSSLNAFLHNRNIATPGFTRITFATAKPNWFVKAGDLDADGKPDIVSASANTNTNVFTVDIFRNKNCHKPVFLNDQPITICSPQSKVLQAIPALNVSFSWLKDAAPLAGTTPNQTITASGTYTITTIGEGGVCTNSASIVVGSGSGAPPDPGITGATSVCAGSNTSFTATGGTVGDSYIWDGPNNFTITQTSPTLNIANAGNSNAGLYTVKIKRGSCESNETETQLNVYQIDLSVTNSGSDKLCSGQTITLSVAQGYTTYLWKKDGSTNLGSSFSQSVNASGAYTCSITAGTCNQTTSPINIVVYNPPVANFSPSKMNACIDEVITFTDETVPDPNATSILLWSWAFDDGGTSSSQSPTHAYLTTAGSPFSVSLTASYSGVTGCTNNISKDISVSDIPSPVINTTASEICSGNQATLSTSIAYSTYSWMDEFNAVQGTGPTVIITSPGVYSVSVTDASGCGNTTSITINPKSGCVIGESYIPPIFTPNGDTQNDKWVLTGISNLPDCTISIFDGRGRRVYEKRGYPSGPDGWDGTYNGSPVPDGTYFYVLSCPDSKPLTGSVLIVR